MCDSCIMWGSRVIVVTLLREYMMMVGNDVQHMVCVPGAEKYEKSLYKGKVTDMMMVGMGSLCESRLIRFRSEEHTSELQSLMRISYAVFCLKKKNRSD